MKVRVQSDKTKTTEYRTVKITVGKFIVTDTYTDNKLVGQAWSIKQGFQHTHPSAYEPQRMCFKYHEDISFLESEQCCNYSDFYDVIHESSFITDWTKFKGYSHVLCNYLGMDGCIYRIDKPNPIPLWRRQNYIGGFCNDKYDLPKIVNELKKRS